MSVRDHDGSVCPVCGGLVEVTTRSLAVEDVGNPGVRMVLLQLKRCETCGHRKEASV